MHVNLETAFLREGLETGGATKRLFARMDFHVTVEFGLFRESLDALQATKRSFARMNPFMGGQMTLFGETFFANGTFKRARTGAAQFQTTTLKLLSPAFRAVGRVIRVDILIHVFFFGQKLIFHVVQLALFLVRDGIMLQLGRFTFVFRRGWRENGRRLLKVLAGV